MQIISTSHSYCQEFRLMVKSSTAFQSSWISGTVRWLFCSIFLVLRSQRRTSRTHLCVALTFSTRWGTEIAIAPKLEGGTRREIVIFRSLNKFLYLHFYIRRTGFLPSFVQEKIKLYISFLWNRRILCFNQRTWILLIKWGNNLFPNLILIFHRITITSQRMQWNGNSQNRSNFLVANRVVFFVFTLACTNLCIKSLISWIITCPCYESAWIFAFVRNSW